MTLREQMQDYALIDKEQKRNTTMQLTGFK
jgi:hypothetical protein